jgi:hypothetical protein
MKHILALIGITLLCVAWIKFQLWLKRVDPDKGDYQPGCGACASNNNGGCSASGNGGGCSTDISNTETTVRLSDTGLGESSGDTECKEKRSPS